MLRSAAAILAVGFVLVTFGSTASAHGNQSDDAPVTTSTLPESNADIGRIIPLPNSGQEPQDPGDPGGWQQVALFFLVCAVILAMAGWVIWRGRVNRARRREAGLDRVEVARRAGGDVRKPRPPGIVD
ncbi:MAG: hypothetical protein GY812_12790 [Actinomycetia bacterium]|nr:hypothetical protein [Actinomycetes bacterium]